MINFKSGLLLFGLSLSGLLCGCATVLPTTPKMTSEICRTTADGQLTTVQFSLGRSLFYRDDKNVLIVVNEQGWSNYMWNPGWWNSWLYIVDTNGENCRLVTKRPSDAPSENGSCVIQKAYIYKDKIYVGYEAEWGNVQVCQGGGTWFYKVNKDGSGEESIDLNEFYRLSVRAFIPPRAEFLKDLTSALADKDYERAEDLRAERVKKIAWYLNNYNDYSDSELKATLSKEKEKLENMVGLSDPALCQLREKYVAAISNDKYDDATKILDLIERMEKKYRPELTPTQPQQVAVVQGVQTLPEKIIIEPKEAPSAGKQMRALATMARGLDGGMTSKQQNAWMSLFGLGDFIDASGVNQQN